MNDASPTRVTIPAPRLTAAQEERLSAFLSGCFVLANAEFEDLVPRGIVRDVIEFRRFEMNPLNWLRDAPELPVRALWLLIEEQHALRNAARSAAVADPSIPTPRS